MTSIYNKLKQLQYKEDYPFHMPGHKKKFKDRFIIRCDFQN